jgi:hypothetical protein
VYRERRSPILLRRAGGPVRRPTFGRLEIDATIDDPKAYTKP